MDETEHANKYDGLRPGQGLILDSEWDEIEEVDEYIEVEKEAEDGRRKIDETKRSGVEGMTIFLC